MVAIVDVSLRVKQPTPCFFDQNLLPLATMTLHSLFRRLKHGEYNLFAKLVLVFLFYSLLNYFLYFVLYWFTLV
jgi:hypothetical protein